MAAAPSRGGARRNGAGRNGAERGGTGRGGAGRGGTGPGGAGRDGARAAPGARRWRQTGRCPGETLYYSRCPYTAARERERGRAGSRGTPPPGTARGGCERLRPSRPSPRALRRSRALTRGGGSWGSRGSRWSGGTCNGRRARRVRGLPRAAPRPLHTAGLSSPGPSRHRHRLELCPIPSRGHSAHFSTKVCSCTAGDKSLSGISHCPVWS